MQLFEFFSSEKLSFRTQEAKFLQIAVDEDNIVADPADALPRNDKIVAVTEKAQAPALARNDDGDDPAAADVDLHVRDKAQAVPVAGVDDLAAAQAGKTVTN